MAEQIGRGRRGFLRAASASTVHADFRIRVVALSRVQIRA
jgi:hypothetical protein